MKLRLIFTIILAFLLNDAFSQTAGVQMLCVRDLWKENPVLAFEKLKELGITEIEGGIGRGMDKEEYKSMLQKYGIKTIAIGADFDRLQDKAQLQQTINTAKELGARFVICYWIPHEGDNFTFENVKKAVKVFNSAGKKLQKQGLTLTYHPHGYEFREYDGEGTLFDYLMNKTKPKFVSYQMDVFWIKNPGQDPVALLKKYPDRWKMMHLKDRKIGTPNNPNGRQDVETNVVLGTGDVGIEAAVKTALKLGIKYFFIEDESSRALQQVPKSLEYLRSIGLK